VESLQARLMRASTYAYLRNAQDGTNPQYQAATARVSALEALVDASTAVVDSEILALPDGLLEQFMAGEPGLAGFAVPLNDLLELRPHRLGAESERVLASLGDVLNAPYMIYSRSKSGDMQFAPFTDAAGTVYANSVNGFESNFETHADTQLRRNAWASFSAGLKTCNQAYAATFATEVTKNVVMARLRHHASTEAYLLQPHKIPHAVYNNILDIIQTGLAPHMQRYARLRRRVLGLDRLLYCDIKAPLDPDFNPHDVLRGRLRADPGVAGGDGARLLRLRAQGHGAALGRPGRQHRQVLGCLLRVALRRAPVHPDHLVEHDAQRVHAGA
jgi:oligoendopeptidase F